MNLKNWRTTGAGVAAIMAALADVLVQIVNKDFDASRLGADITGLMTGAGLLFARDAAVSEAQHAENQIQMDSNTKLATGAALMAAEKS